MSSEKFVSRGGDKLEGALDNFKVDVKGKICLDVGASTGGFTDCLLQRGAEKVYAVDTAYGELAWKLRNDPRVVVFERTNILYDRAKLSQIEAQIDILVIDAGWTRAGLVLPEVVRYLKPGGMMVFLIKPQYERKETKKGTVLDEETSEEVANEVRKKLQGIGFETSELYVSPVKGDSGNQEYFVLVTKVL